MQDLFSPPHCSAVRHFVGDSVDGCEPHLVHSQAINYDGGSPWSDTIKVRLRTAEDGELELSELVTVIPSGEAEDAT